MTNVELRISCPLCSPPVSFGSDRETTDFNWKDRVRPWLKAETTDSVLADYSLPPASSKN
ncbi:hypothetical protein VD0002_g7999 [Verticillium dahliae]|nr:hypothetical protein VD0003_g9132 [Verticillium dahliae]PNH59559.1 hypothetical protein VD0002_g7999 [Verticillium dahliae]